MRNSVRFQDSERSRSGAGCNRSVVRCHEEHLFFPVLPAHIHSGSAVRRMQVHNCRQGHRMPVDSRPVQVSGIRPADWEQELLRAVHSRSEERLQVHRDWLHLHRHKS